jgi:MSHA biogenesis protein MshK
MRGGSVSKVLLISLLLCASTTFAASPGRDPTLPPQNLLPATMAASDSTPMELQAVLRGARGSRAVIAGQSLRVGDTVADARVLAIYVHSVLIERQGQRQLLRLAEPVMQPSR